jgi:hypothetical protein
VQKLNGSGFYEKEPFVACEGNRTVMQAELDLLKRRVDCIETADPVFKLLRFHFTDFVEVLQMDFDSMYKDPGCILFTLSERLYDIAGADYRSEEMRAGIYLALINSFEGIWHDGIFAMLYSLEPDKLQNILSGLERVIEYSGFAKQKIHASFKCMSNAKTAELLSETDTFIEKLRAKASDVRSRIEKTGGTARTGQKADNECLGLDQDEYRKTLKKNIGVNLDELLSWRDDEVEKTREEALRIANSLSIAETPVKSMREVSGILFKNAGPCESPEEMFRRADTYLKRTRAAAHEYVWLPEDELCECVCIPEPLKDSYPWGGYSGDHYSRYRLRNTMFLNNHNYKAVTDGWIKINALHEAYPGHHCQYIRASIDPLPETVKLGAKHIPLTEGVCHRTERAFEFVFSEDPFYPLMVAQRRHHTSVRIKIDLMLRYFNKTIGEACDLYEEELGFDRKTARAQVQAHENMKGYFTSYYYGMKKICDWEKLYAYDKREYTSLLFSVGRVSLETFERILKLSEEDRHSFLHDFGSLLQFC